MEILLLGKNSTINDTIHSMLQSVDNWAVTVAVELSSLCKKTIAKLPDFDLLIANLEDYEIPSIPLITKIKNHFSATPLIVVHSYSDDRFIEPMLNAGATGYIKSGVSEHQLFEAVKKVGRGQKIVIADSTY